MARRWWWPHEWGEYAARALIRLVYRMLGVTPPDGSVLNAREPEELEDAEELVEYLEDGER